MIDQVIGASMKFSNAKSSMHDRINELRLTKEEREKMFDLLWDMENAFGDLKTVASTK